MHEIDELEDERSPTVQLEADEIDELEDERAPTAQLEAEVWARSRLHQLSAHLLTSRDLTSALEAVLDAAIELHGADMGNVQLYDPERHVLRIVASRGFGAEFLEHFAEVGTEEETACGRALRRADRY